MDETNCAEETNSLGPLTVNQFGERYFFNLNRHDFEKVSANTLFDTKFSEVLFSEDALNIIVGTDSGLLPRYIQEKSLPKGTRYIFIEPEEVLQELQAKEMLADLDERILCIPMSEWDRALLTFKVTDYFYIDAVRSFNAICAEDDFISEYAELSWHITEVLSQLHWQNSVELGMEAFIARQIHNLADNRLPAKLLENAFKGKTVVLLAGGPSLDAALPWVKLNRSHLLVFAVSRISRQLIAEDIEPDFICSVDPTELSFDISKEMLNFSDRVTFICSYHTVPTLLNQWLGQVFYLGARLPWDSGLNVANLSSAGPTVTNTALSVAHQLGAKRIILAGVDLCFTREGFTHAKGSDEELAGPRFNLTSLQVETNAGYLAPTSCDFAQAILSLGFQARALNKVGCEIINFSEAAAKIEGIHFSPLADIKLVEDVGDVAAIIAVKLEETPNELSYFQNTLKELKKAQFQIKAINRLAIQACQINAQMYSNNGMVVNFDAKKKLDQIEKKFKREHRHFSKLVKRFGIRRFIKLAKPFSDEEWTAEEAKQLGDVYYQAYVEGANKLLKLINFAIERVAARHQECIDTPDYGLLIEQARVDRSFGRVRLWRKKFAAMHIPFEVLETFGEFERCFIEIVNDKKTRHFARAKSHSNLTSVRQRAGLLFKHKKPDELSDLLAALDKHAEKEAASSYCYLIKGYLAELSGNSAQALEAYHCIVDAGNVLLEEALVRIAAISIDNENESMADLSLQCLSQLNPVFLPMYAEIRRLHGDFMGAVDAYVSYINQFPVDVSVQMKLAMLYVEFKIYDGALMMLEHILQNQPGMEAAKVLIQHLQEQKAVELLKKN